ncbi:MAG: fibrobacter succinogenes major paralogous domain-containing protein [Bacteroidales bacterium]|nr:fibrobacter succinogenes major paralogous domain-containing protein [Bacteroidales bacterium]
MSCFSLRQRDPKSILDDYKTWLENDVYGDYTLLNLEDPSYLQKLSFWQAENVRRHIRELVNNEDESCRKDGIRMQETASLITKSLYNGFVHLNNSLVNSSIENGTSFGSGVLAGLDQKLLASFIAIQSSMSQGVCLLSNRLFKNHSIFEKILNELHIPKSNWVWLCDLVEILNGRPMYGSLPDKFQYDIDDLSDLIEDEILVEEDFISCYYKGLICLYFLIENTSDNLLSIIETFVQCEKYAKTMPETLSKGYFLYDEMLIMKAECYYLRMDFDNALNTIEPIISHSSKATLRAVKYLSATHNPMYEQKALEIFKDLVDKNIYVLVQILEDSDIMNNEFIYKFVKEQRSELLKYIQKDSNSDAGLYEHLGILDIYLLIQNGDESKNAEENKRREVEKIIPKKIDFGLPSGILWAECNVGADAPWKAGKYYAWGETLSKRYYEQSTYKYIKTNLMGGRYANLEAIDDVATQSWGAEWHIPRDEDWQELIHNTHREWTDNYNGTGVKGYVLTSDKKGYERASIFLPAAGKIDVSRLSRYGDVGHYLTSSFWMTDLRSVRILIFSSDAILTEMDCCGYYYGRSVRPVCHAHELTNGHDAVDLGLPSGKLWATCNVGASAPQESGSYYAFGETETKNCYSNETYKSRLCAVTKYNSIDNKVVLEAIDDVARQRLGDEWRMPTIEDWKELCDNTTQKWTDDYNGTGVAGYILTSTKYGYTNVSIFLPAAGYRFGRYLSSEGFNGYYWSSSLNESYSSNARNLLFYEGHFSHYSSNSGRCSGFSVRPVCPSQK